MSAHRTCVPASGSDRAPPHGSAPTTPAGDAAWPDVRSVGTAHRERAQTLFDQRRARTRHFGSHALLFQEAAWDILLELFLCHEDGVDPPATSIAHDAGVPRSTAARSIVRLQDEGLVLAWTDAADSRVRRLRLTSYAVDIVRGYLESL